MTRRHAWAALLALVLLVVCGASPGTAATRGIDYVLLVDNTGSMRYGHRAEATLEALSSFIELMESGDRVSVFSYGERVEPVLASYPVQVSDDVSRDSITDRLDFSFDGDRTDMTAAVARVWEERGTLFRRQPGAGGAGGSLNGVVVLMTDGSLIPVYDDYSRYGAVFAASKTRLEDLARSLGDAGIPVHVVAVGRKEKVDDDLTRYVALASGGTFTWVDEASGVTESYLGILEATELVSRDEEGYECSTPAADSQASTQVAEARTPYARSSNLADYMPPGLLERYAAILAIFVGAVALGVDRRMPWALAFTRKVGKSDVRVRGYLRPVDAPGVFSARPIIGLENPGLPSIKVGVDTPYVNHARETVAEFIGTNDGTPPELIVEKGRVLVEGEEVTAPRKLRDGDLIEIEKVLYRYLRGNRR